MRASPPCRASTAKLAKPEVSDAFMQRIAAIGAAGNEQALPASAQPIAADDAATPSRARRARAGWSARSFGSFDWRAMAASIVVSAVLASGATQWVMLNGRVGRF